MKICLNISLFLIFEIDHNTEFFLFYAFYVQNLLLFIKGLLVDVENNLTYIDPNNWKYKEIINI